MLKKTTKSTEKLTYCQPKVYSLGSLEKVEANYAGGSQDGPDPAFRYNG